MVMNSSSFSSKPNKEAYQKEIENPQKRTHSIFLSQNLKNKVKIHFLKKLIYSKISRKTI
jgi:hypothetical protein